MKIAIAKLVESQKLEEMWPAIIKGSAATGALEVERGAREAVDKEPGLTPVHRAKAYEIIAEMAPQVAAEIDEHNRKMPVKTLVTDMAYAVYPKYYTASEIEELARFYSGGAFQKLAAFSIQASEEAKRTGKSVDAVMPKYLAKLTPQEAKVLVGFSNSVAGRKQQRVGSAIAEEGRQFLVNNMNDGVEAIGARFGERLRARFRQEFEK